MVLICTSLVAKEVEQFFMLIGYLKFCLKTYLSHLPVFLLMWLRDCKSYLFSIYKLFVGHIVINISYSVGPVSFSVIVYLGCYNKSTIDWVA